ncbi:Cysteine-rich protein 2 [Leucoagaricus sp. SymC.cos]|nr:Cysteine-rich protein 2 [Leucoagaricus sp. SymC.cos]
MHPFGGTQICPRCSKAVYAAEQVMGPGRKVYYRKTSISRYLYHSKNCYTKNFSARDLRQANLPVQEASTSPTPASPPRAINDSHSPPSLPARVTSPTRQSNNSTFPLPRLKPTHSLPSPTSSTFPPLDPSLSTELKQPMAPPLPGRPVHQSSNSASSANNTRSSQNDAKSFSSASFSTFGRANNATSAALSLLEQEGLNPLVQTSTGTRYGAALGGTIPTCPKCSQRVYFAEQVKAVGKTWHKNCLRCRECNTLLDSNRLRDHDGVPFCVRCYNKLHGPQGSGYALLGKAGG